MEEAHRHHGHTLDHALAHALKVTEETGRTDVASRGGNNVSIYPKPNDVPATLIKWESNVVA